MTAITVHCPECKKNTIMKNPVRTNERLEAQEGVAPEKGACTICENCFVILVLGEQGWRVQTPEEWITLSVDERKMLQRMQELFIRRHRRNSGEDVPPLTEEQADLQLSYLLSKVPDEIMGMVPLMVALKMGKDKAISREKLKSFTTQGLSYAVKAVAERPETRTIEDLRSIVPLLLAIALIENEMDVDKALRSIEETIKKETPEGVDLDALRVEGILP